MTKKKNEYFCKDCDYISLQWMGKCPSCNSWNSFTTSKEGSLQNETSSLLKLSDISPTNSRPLSRIKTGLNQLDNLIGGGFTIGSLTLLSGSPGVGKSTLVMQVCSYISSRYKDHKVIYVTGEESSEQVSQRASRLGVKSENIFVANEKNVENIIELAQKHKPKFLVIDSIQTTSSKDINSTAGSVSQIREVTSLIIDKIKSYKITTLLIGHITKDGNLAGPKHLEHMVDTVISFEVDNCENLRVLRCSKNRFGSTDEVGLFEMSEDGLIDKLIKKNNLNEKLLGNSRNIIFKGRLPVEINFQALVVENKTTNVKRVCKGVESIKFNLLIAIIEKYLNIPLYKYDIYLNTSEGITSNDTSNDLAIITSILSSYYKIPIDNCELYSGELSLSGTIKLNPQVDRFVKTLKTLGYHKANGNFEYPKNSKHIEKFECIFDFTQTIFHKKLAS